MNRRHWLASRGNRLFTQSNCGVFIAGRFTSPRGRRVVVQELGIADRVIVTACLAAQYAACNGCRGTRARIHLHNHPRVARQHPLERR